MAYFTVKFIDFCTVIHCQIFYCFICIVTFLSFVHFVDFISLFQLLLYEICTIDKCFTTFLASIYYTMTMTMNLFQLRAHEGQKIIGEILHTMIEHNKNYKNTQYKHKR